MTIIAAMQNPADLPPPYPGFWRGILRGLIERALRLFYTARAAQTPVRLKVATLLALLYFIYPFDLVADLLPLLGFGDDLIALSLLAWALSRHTSDEERLRARAAALRIVP